MELKLTSFGLINKIEIKYIAYVYKDPMDMVDVGYKDPMDPIANYLKKEIYDNFITNVKEYNFDILVDLTNILKIFKLNHQLEQNFNEVIYDIISNFLSIEYYVNKKKCYYLPISEIYNLRAREASASRGSGREVKSEKNKITITDLYHEIINSPIFINNVCKEIEADKLILSEINNYLKMSGFIITNFQNKKYYTNNYAYFIDKYLYIDILDIIKTDNNIINFIDFCKFIKLNYKFSIDHKNLIMNKSIIYDIFMPNELKLIFSIILND